MKEGTALLNWCGSNFSALIQLHIEENGILTQLIHSQSSHSGRLRVGAVAGLVCLFSMVVAFATIAQAPIGSTIQQQVAESLIPAPIALSTDTQNRFLYESQVQHGDTVAALLERLMVSDSAAMDFLRANISAQAIFRQLSPGKSVVAHTTLHGELQTLIFPLNGETDHILAIERQGDSFTANERPLQMGAQIVAKSAEIRHSLFGASDAMEIPDAIAMQLTTIFGGDIDFQRDLRKGDHFSVVYELFTYLGRPLRSGRVLAAEFVNDGKIYRAAWFANPAETSGGGYYTENGKNIRKAFLRSPLEFSRITSGFTTARFHPVLRLWKAHKGIDYGAPVGTHVKSTGDGIVDFVGIKGGYGKVVIMRHQNRYTTLYGHLSGFAPGVRKGSRVNQGDIIAFVGATGLASGPHLHYEFRTNDVHQNPLAAVLPGARPLTTEQLIQFHGQTAGYLANLDLLHSFNLAQSD